jgi:hypothetical protein
VARHTGTASLPLHSGKAPRWLFSRMVRLSREIVVYMAGELGPRDVLGRLSDPFWFQSFGCVLGFDWHSSGVTTTVCGAVKEALAEAGEEIGLFAAGGKGAASRRTPGQIAEACERLGRDPGRLVHASRMAAKVDSAAVQDGYQLYHHSFFFTAAGDWCVVQQGMNDRNRMARRYHWLSDHVTSFVEEPHQAVCCDVRGEALNLVAEESAQARVVSTDLAGRPPEVTLRELARVPELRMPARHTLFPDLDVAHPHLRKILTVTYERAPKDFEALLGIPPACAIRRASPSRTAGRTARPFPWTARPTTARSRSSARRSTALRSTVQRKWPPSSGWRASATTPARIDVGGRPRKGRNRPRRAQC